MRYPKGFLSNLPKENLTLMQETAKAVGVLIEFGEAKTSVMGESRKQRVLAEFVGVYLAESERRADNLDLRVQALMEHYSTLQLREYFKRQPQTETKGQSNGLDRISKQNRRRI